MSTFEFTDKAEVLRPYGHDRVLAANIPHAGGYRPWAEWPSDEQFAEWKDLYSRIASMKVCLGRGYGPYGRFTVIKEGK